MIKKFLIFFLFLAIFFLFFFRLGDRSFRNPDEGRYAEVAREMIIHKDWLEPQLYGADYLRKPVLFYWLIVLSYQLFGMTEFAARLVPALFGLLGVFATYFFARATMGRRQAVFSAVLLATNVWYLQVSRYLLIDAVFSFFLVAAFYCFYLAFTSTALKRAYYMLFYLFVGLAFLTKGLAGLVIPGLGIFVYVLLRGQLGQTLREMFLPLGAVIFLGVVLPWFVAIAMHEPEFLEFFFIHEQFSRYTSSHFEHQEPFYFYFLVLPLMYFPWVFFPVPLKNAYMELKKWRLNTPDLYLFICAAATIAFYSLSKSKLPTYILPCIPLLSVLLGKSWAAMNGAPEGEKGSRWVRFSAIAIVMVMAASFFVLVSPLISVSWFRKLPLDARPPLLGLLLILVTESLLGLYLLKRRNWDGLFISVALSLAVASAPIAWAMEAVNANYTTRHFANALKPLLRPGDQVFVFEQPGAFYDFAFYLEYPVRLVGLSGELEYTKGDLAEKDAALDYEDFNRLLTTDQRIYCLMRKSDYLEMAPDLKKYVALMMADERKALIRTIRTV